VKKFFFATFFAGTGAIGSLQAQSLLVEAKAGYFVPFSNSFDRIYGGGGIYGLEATLPFSCHSGGALWVSASYFGESGTASSLGDVDSFSTTVDIVPLGLGFKYFFNAYKFRVYLGIGGLATYLHTRDDSPFVIRNTTAWGTGIIGKAGLLYCFGRHFFVDIFSDVNYTRITFDRNPDDAIIRFDVNLSGWTTGVGLGYKF
jgi:outer membrane protein W